MKLKTYFKAVSLLASSIFLMVGCASQQTVQNKRYVWPAPPEQPKIEWIKSYYAQNDFPKSGFSVFLDTLLGRPDQVKFDKPIDVKSNGKGLVYVTDISLQGIFLFDLNLEKTEFWSRGSDPDRSLALNPYFISLDSSGNLYAVGTGSNNVFVTDEKGVFLRKFDYSAQVKSPGGILADSNKQRIYLVDNSNSKIAVFDLTGKHLFSFGAPGDKDGELNRPSPLAMNSKGELIVGDVMNARIQVFNSEGKFIRKFGKRGDGGSDFQVIKGVAVDSDDNIYVTDGKANKIKIFSGAGDYLLSFGSAYSVTQTMKEAPGGFLLPQGIFIDSTDTIFVADQANLRFQVFKYLKEAPLKEAEDALKEKK